MHLQTVCNLLAARIRELQQRLDALRQHQVPPGQARLQRDQETHTLSRRIATITRLGGDVCLGRMDRRDGTRAYVGRLGLRDADGHVLLVDWRTPEAEPFFAATMQSPLGLLSRRRFRRSDGRVVHAWDEWLDLAAQQDTGLPDAQSAFLATLAASRTGRMTSALATIQVDQDAIVRADTRGCTVVDGGPGTGKTVVALHRAAYVAFRHRQEVPYITPHARLASYVSDVLPALGEEDVPVATLEELYAERATRRDPRPELVRLKGDGRMLDAVASAVTFFEDLPMHEVVAQLPDGDVVVRPQHWRQALASCSEVQHEPRRAELLEALAELLDEPLVATDHMVAAALRGTWPDLTPADVVRDLLTHRALLPHCAPWLSAAQRRVVRDDALQDGCHLTDLPLLDVARQRLSAATPVELPAAELAHRRESVQATVSALREAADDGNMLFLLEQGHPDLMDTAQVLEPDAAPVAPPLGQRVFGHVVVDEAQNLTAVEWQVVLWRCPNRSLTAVGDRAQSRRPFAESWEQRLDAVGVARSRVLRLTVSYRTPAVLMAPAAAVIRAPRPDALVPDAVRTDGRPLEIARIGGDLLTTAVERAQALRGNGTAVIVAHPDRTRPVAANGVALLAPDELQGLEMDVVVLVEPAELLPDDHDGGAAAALYVALTRATQAVVVLHQRDLPKVAQPLLHARGDTNGNPPPPVGRLARTRREPSQTAQLRLEEAVVAGPDDRDHGEMSQVDDSSYTPLALDSCWRISGPFFHGTRVALQVGDELVPGHVSNFHQGRVMNNIYFTTLMETAVWGAELATALAGTVHRGYVYEVKPMGPFEDDPNVTNKKFPGNITQSYRSRYPLLVTRPVHDWQGHNREALDNLLTSIRLLREQDRDVIND